MRLINTQTLKLQDFSGRKRPPYAILSHTWGDDEVTFQNLRNLEDVSQKRGYSKIIGCCKQARRDGYEYVWIDSCCIDKYSSAELSEAINSMFQWYADSEVCYAYLVDVEPICERQTDVASALQSSRWFKRGWTLQELLAPSKLILFASDWSKVGTRDNLASEINTITMIDRVYLAGMRSRDPGSLLNRASVAERMSWASGRETTRVEDTAY